MINHIFDIVLPTIGRKSLEAAVDSVINQDYPNWYLYIIGDWVDTSYMLLKDDRIIPHSVKGPGNDNGAFARNFGISVSDNTWITYLDDDDRWFPNHLSTFVRMLEQHPETNLMRTSGHSFSWKHKHPRSSQLVKKYGAINHSDILTVGMAHTRALFNETDGWQPGTAHDKDLWNQMCEHNALSLESKEVTFEFCR